MVVKMMISKTTLLLLPRERPSTQFQFQPQTQRCPSKKLKKQKATSDPGKEDCFFDGGLDSIQPSLDLLDTTAIGVVADCNNYNDDSIGLKSLSLGCEEEEEMGIEEEFLEERSTKLDVLFNELSAGTDDEPGNDRDDREDLEEGEEGKGGILISCPLCGAAGLTYDLRQVHTNECLDKVDGSTIDTFKYLRRDCSHWFLTHFHLDHYQGLTKSFCHGKIYCSAITAKMVNLKIGISYDKIQVLPLSQKINIAGIDVICFDANHCRGAIIILFEPPNGKPVLHTVDFRCCGIHLENLSNPYSYP